MGNYQIADYNHVRMVGSVVMFSSSLVSKCFSKLLCWFIMKEMIFKRKYVDLQEEKYVERNYHFKPLVRFFVD